MRRNHKLLLLLLLLFGTGLLLILTTTNRSQQEASIFQFLNTSKQTIHHNKMSTWEIQRDKMSTWKIQQDEMSNWKILQESRRASIHGACTNQKTNFMSTCMRGDYNEPGSYLRTLLVDIRHSVIYCAIPKVASSSMKMAIAHSTGLVAPSNKFDPHNTTHLYNVALYNLGYLLQWYPKKLLSGTLPKWWYSFKKFIVVRDPFERLVSAYMNKLSRLTNKNLHFHRRFGEQIVQMRQKNPNSSSNTNDTIVTFSEFVDFITNENIKCGNRINEHWNSYTNLCRPCQINYDHVIRYENFDREMSHVLRTLYGASHVSIPRINAEKTREMVEILRKQLTDVQREKLNRLYARDVQMFGYKPI